jgi:hypothetical protein
MANYMWQLKKQNIRNTMSHRNLGNVFAYATNEQGLFDLNRFNDKYWQRFENFLKLCYKRDIIVQIEIWDSGEKIEWSKKSVSL